MLQEISQPREAEAGEGLASFADRFQLQPTMRARRLRLERLMVQVSLATFFVCFPNQLLIIHNVVS